MITFGGGGKEGDHAHKNNLVCLLWKKEKEKGREESPQKTSLKLAPTKQSDSDQVRLIAFAWIGAHSLGFFWVGWGGPKVSH